MSTMTPNELVNQRLGPSRSAPLFQRENPLQQRHAHFFNSLASCSSRSKRRASRTYFAGITIFPDFTWLVTNSFQAGNRDTFIRSLDLLSTKLSVHSSSQCCFSSLKKCRNHLSILAKGSVPL